MRNAVIVWNPNTIETRISSRTIIKGKEAKFLTGFRYELLLFFSLNFAKISCHFEPNPNHLAKKNLFFPREASFSAFDETPGLGDCKIGVASFTARISVVLPHL